MTPAAVMSAIPYDLIRRRPNPDAQLANAKALARWLLVKGHRPSLAEIEAERARRTPTNHREVDRHRGSTTKEK